MTPNDGEKRAPSGIVLLVGTGVLWGTIGVASKGVLEHSALDPVSITWLRTLLASPLCIMAVWISGGRALLRFSNRDLLGMIGLGLVLALYQWLYLAGVEQIGVTTTTLISLCGAPVIATLLSVILLHEHLSRAQWGALAGALLGAGLLIGRPTGMDGGNGMLGVICALGCAFGMAVHAMGSRQVAGRVHALVVLAIGFSAGALALGPFMAFRGLHPHAGQLAWGLVIYLAAVPSVLAYFLYQRGLRDVPASMAMIVTLLEPMIAAVLAWFLFDERLGIEGLIGGALLLGSIWLLSTRALKRTPTTAPLAAGGS